jgi:hypothetical protein
MGWRVEKNVRVVSEGAEKMNPFSIFYPLFFIYHVSTLPQTAMVGNQQMGGKKTWDRWHRRRQQTFLLVVTDFDKVPWSANSTGARELLYYLESQVL